MKSDLLHLMPTVPLKGRGGGIRTGAETSGPGKPRAGRPRRGCSQGPSDAVRSPVGSYHFGARRVLPIPEKTVSGADKQFYRDGCPARPALGNSDYHRGRCQADSNSDILAMIHRSFRGDPLPSIGLPGPTVEFASPHAPVKSREESCAGMCSGAELGAQKEGCTVWVVTVRSWQSRFMPAQSVISFGSSLTVFSGQRSPPARFSIPIRVLR